jgi:uncharacterized DUF497 family protein
MQIVWDEPKRISNIKKHGFDFADLDFVFFENAKIVMQKKNRFKAMGLFKNRIVSVIFASLGSEALSIISMRFANKSEYKQ